MAIVEHTLVPGLLGAPHHRHSREDEISCVLEGELTVGIESDFALVPAGGVIVKPRGRLHTFWNAGAQPVRFLEVISPGGFEEYFRELAGIIPSDAPPDMGTIASLAARCGMEFNLESLPSCSSMASGSGSRGQPRTASVGCIPPRTAYYTVRLCLLENPSVAKWVSVSNWT